MTDGEMDEVFKRAAKTGEAPPGPDPAVMERVRGKVLSSLKPVRPLAPARVWILALLAVFLSVAIAGGGILGMYGVRALDNTQRVAIFGLLVAGAVAAAVAVSWEMTPTGARAVHPGIIAAAGIMAFLGAFALLFRSYNLDRFARGVSCLKAGLLWAAITAALVWLILRRGFVLDRIAAGAATGTFAGLAGLAVLELHCPILNAPHVLVWHLAVLVASVLAGSAAGWAMGRFGRSDRK